MAGGARLYVGEVARGGVCVQVLAQVDIEVVHDEVQAAVVPEHVAQPAPGPARVSPPVAGASAGASAHRAHQPISRRRAPLQRKLLWQRTRRRTPCAELFAQNAPRHLNK